MMGLAKMVASFFGIGYIQKGAGTLAALFCCCIFLLLKAQITTPVLIVVTVLVLATGVWSAGRVEAVWGHDSNRIVLDEVLGMCVSLVLVPLQLTTIAAAFILFRIFDIAKPLYIRRAEQLRGGWGVMADDVLAGIYANVVMQVLLMTNIL